MNILTSEVDPRAVRVNIDTLSRTVLIKHTVHPIWISCNPCEIIDPCRHSSLVISCPGYYIILGALYDPVLLYNSISAVSSVSFVKCSFMCEVATVHHISESKTGYWIGAIGKYWHLTCLGPAILLATW